MTNPNDPTFARAGDPPVEGYGGSSGDSGLTKREHFAVMAMQGLCANSIAGPHRMSDFLVKEAVQMSNALIAELNKEIK